MKHAFILGPISFVVNTYNSIVGKMYINYYNIAPPTAQPSYDTPNLPRLQNENSVFFF
jgi:hypothetical protein